MPVNCIKANSLNSTKKTLKFLPKFNCFLVFPGGEWMESVSVWFKQNVYSCVSMKAIFCKIKQWTISKIARCHWMMFSEYAVKILLILLWRRQMNKMFYVLEKFTLICYQVRWFYFSDNSFVKAFPSFIHSVPTLLQTNCSCDPITSKYEKSISITLCKIILFLCLKNSLWEHKNIWQVFPNVGISITRFLLWYFVFLQFGGGWKRR